MNFSDLKKIQLIAELYYEKHIDTVNANSDIAIIKTEYSNDVKNNCEQNFTIQKENKIEFENRIEECVIYYQNLLNEKYSGL